MTSYDINPVAKPRMTQRDKWAKRPAVLRYFAFKDECRLKKVELSIEGDHVTFYIPMPKSWSGKKKNEHYDTPHMQKPDCDNLLKALMDAVYEDDSSVYDVRITKFWSYEGKIIIE